ncbi:unnamed protein product [Cylindrotheca closterium]|uniref:Helicase-associated domain-containing protein n=1 Tax=Cylindrotheca closterium TaxID=2856 RepID=A0AAD2JNV8_9STRA|nr:unnamed protein product [Cylindrotheca closterium]
MNTTNGFLAGFDNRLCTAGHSNQKRSQEEELSNMDPYPLVEAPFTMTTRDPFEGDLGFLLDFMPSSPLFDSSGMDSNKEQVLKGSIGHDEYKDETCAGFKRNYQVFDSTETESNQEHSPKRRMEHDAGFYQTDSRAPSLKRSRKGEGAESSAPAGDASPIAQEALPRFRDYQETQWQEHFRGLLEFKQKHGHCCVPNKLNENPILGRWVKRQRHQHKLLKQGHKSTLIPHRVKALEDAGFIWDSHAALWEERLNELKKYRRFHGHCNVPSTFSQNPQLSTWVKCQRRQYRLYFDQKASSNLTEERISALNQLGFKWDEHDAILIARCMMQIKTKFDTDEGLNFIQQYYINQGLKKFGDDGKDAVDKESGQMLLRDCFTPEFVKDMTASEQKKAITIYWKLVKESYSMLSTVK